MTLYRDIDVGSSKPNHKPSLISHHQLFSSVDSGSELTPLLVLPPLLFQVQVFEAGWVTGGAGCSPGGQLVQGGRKAWLWPLNRPSDTSVITWAGPRCNRLQWRCRGSVNFHQVMLDHRRPSRGPYTAAVTDYPSYSYTSSILYRPLQQQTKMFPDLTLLPSGRQHSPVPSKSLRINQFYDVMMLLYHNVLVRRRERIRKLASEFPHPEVTEF